MDSTEPMAEEDITVHCFDCKAPWIISGAVVRRATELLADEFPDGALIAFPVPSGYLCEACQQERLSRGPGRKPRAASGKVRH